MRNEIKENTYILFVKVVWIYTLLRERNTSVLWQQCWPTSTTPGRGYLSPPLKLILKESYKISKI
jgi:hypothetical protein